MISKTTILKSENLHLRIPSLDDIESTFSATRFPGFNDGMLWEPPKDKSELIAPYHRTIQAWEIGEAYSFTIERKETEDFLGRISIRKTKEDKVWDVGFWTHPAHWGKGIMTEALAIIVKFGFEQLEARRIEACHATWNKASEKVLQKNRMTFVKFIEQGFKKHGKWVPENQYAIEFENW
ncbi:MAG: GNAT family N-acetyltransferase [Bacteroidota bacterium]